MRGVAGQASIPSSGINPSFIVQLPAVSQYHAECGVGRMGPKLQAAVCPAACPLPAHCKPLNTHTPTICKQAGEATLWAGTSVVGIPCTSKAARSLASAV